VADLRTALERGSEVFPFCAYAALSVTSSSSQGASRRPMLLSRIGLSDSSNFRRGIRVTDDQKTGGRSSKWRESETIANLPSVVRIWVIKKEEERRACAKSSSGGPCNLSLRTSAKGGGGPVIGKLSCGRTKSPKGREP